MEELVIPAKIIACSLLFGSFMLTVASYYIIAVLEDGFKKLVEKIDKKKPEAERERDIE